MTDVEKIEAWRQRITKAVDKAKDMGFRIISSSWGIQNWSEQASKWDGDAELTDRENATCLCPLGCVLVMENVGPLGHIEGVGMYGALATLGIEHDEISSFIEGFDSAANPSGTSIEFFHLGQELRKEFKPKDCSRKEA